MRTVLVIDDDDMVRSVVQAALEGAGCQVHNAADGEEGLRILQGGDVHLVIVDLELPDLDGRAVIRELKCRESPIPIVALTSFADVALGEILQLGVAQVFVKPFHVHELQDAVSSLLTGGTQHPP